MAEAVDDWRPKHSLADDPTFLASLEGLDAGLAPEPGDAPPSPDSVPDAAPVSAPRAPAPASRAAQPQPPDQPPRVIARDGVGSPPPSPRPVAPAPSPATASVAGAARRSVLELFPPAPTDVIPSGPPRAAARRAPISAPPLRPPAASRPIAPEPIAPEPIAPPEPKSYLTFYSLDEDPFSPAPDPRFFFHSASHDRVSQDLLTGIRRREGVVLVSGPSGVGRTTMCHTVVEQLDRRTLTSYLEGTPATFDELVATVLADFGVISRTELAVRERPASELLVAMREFLLTLAPLQAFGVLFVDDAQRISSAVLRQVAALAEIGGDERLLQIVLVGSDRLERKLARRDMRGLARDVTVRCRLAPLDEEEVGAYVMHRLMVAGRNPRVEFSEAAFARLHEISGGLPARINRICDRALEAGAASSTSLIERAEIDEAARAAGVEPPESRLVAAARLALGIGSLILLMAAGAVGAAYVFHDRVASAITRWERIPPAPGRPPATRMPPLPPITLPPAS